MKSMKFITGSSEDKKSLFKKRQRARIANPRGTRLYPDFPVPSK